MAKKIQIDIINREDNYIKKPTKSLNKAMKDLKSEKINGFSIRQKDVFFEIALDEKGKPFINSWETKKIKDLSHIILDEAPTIDEDLLSKLKSK